MVVSMQATTILDALGHGAGVSRLMDKRYTTQDDADLSIDDERGLTSDHGSWDEIRLWSCFLMSADEMA